MPSSITINGVTIVASSRSNVVVVDGRVIVDGKDVTPDAKQISIEVHGDVGSIQADACGTIRVAGSVGDLATQTGNVHCGAVTGSVQTMSGNVRCSDVAGSVSTMSGNINRP